ncbi:MAG: SHOCT domain-containing protein [Acidimicrobiales bacterium]
MVLDMSAGVIVSLVILGTSIWVAIDASRIGARKGLVNGLADMGPAGWFFCCLLVWIIGFPVYLTKRSQIIHAVAAAATAVPPQDSTVQVVPYPLVPPPPNLYPSPIAQGQRGSWEGTASAVTSKADELSKLAALLQSGVLTQEEFDTEKAKLLAAPSLPVTPPLAPS